jgi:hypothetical protein
MTANDGEPEEIDPAHLAAVREGLAQTARRQFATDADVKAALGRFERRARSRKTKRPPVGGRQ